MNTPSSPRRAFILIAVLAVMGTSLLIAMTLLLLAQSHAASMNGAAARVQSRSLAWSGVQVVMVELDGQRDTILAGDLPEVPDQLVIYEAGDRQGVVRLLSVGPDDEMLVAESGLLDLNGVDAETLVATGFVDETQAAAIVAYRDGHGGTIGSVAELLRVEGITAEMLYGDLADRSFSSAVAGEEGDLAERVLGRLGDTEPRGLADLLTVYAFEPALQRNGRRRISLNVAWSDELGERLDERFGDGAAGVVQGIMNNGVRFDSESVIYSTLRVTGMDTEDWPEIVDTITTDPEVLHFGRLNINTASVAALAALPGLELAQAEQIVRTRDGVAAEDRDTIVWPLLEGILEKEDYETLGGLLTCRSWTYRLRLAAGEVDADDPDGPLLDPVVLEIVLDLAQPRTRVAYLRDVTFLDTAVALAEREVVEDEDVEPIEVDEAEAADESGEPDPSAAPEVLDDADPVEMSDDHDRNGVAPSGRRRVGRWVVDG